LAFNKAALGNGGGNAFKELRTIKEKLWEEIKDFNLRMEREW